MLVNTSTEEQASIASVDNLEIVPKLNKIGLVFLVTWSDKAVDFAFQLLLLIVVVWAVPFGQPRFASGQYVSVKSKACERSRSTHWRFWMRMNESTIVVLRIANLCGPVLLSWNTRRMLNISYPGGMKSLDCKVEIVLGEISRHTKTC